MFAVAPASNQLSAKCTDRKYVGCIEAGCPVASTADTALLVQLREMESPA